MSQNASGRPTKEPAQTLIHDHHDEIDTIVPSSEVTRPDFVTWVFDRRHDFESLAFEIISDGGWPADIYSLSDLDAYLNSWPAIEIVKRMAHQAMREYVKEVV